MFRSHTLEKVNELPEAIDLSHHLSLKSRSRTENVLKSLYKYMQQPDIISLAGGIPHPQLFPYESMSAEIMPPNALATKPPTLNGSDDSKDTVKDQSFFAWLFGKKPTRTVEIPKYEERTKENPHPVDLATMLQYQTVEGHPALQEFIRNFVANVYKPGYKNWGVQLNVGASAGWNQVAEMLMERGDALLVEEFSYPGAMNSYRPMDIKSYGVKLDGEGIIVEDLERILANWDEQKEGRRRPRVFYTVPTGQNPTGATMLAERKKAVYEVCVKYDVIIVEDEPYYFLYADAWVPKRQRKSIASSTAALGEKEEIEAFFKKLPPSYLRFDYQGRVIRLDSFSKTIAPGSRLGWFTANPLFTDRLLRGCEAEIMMPNGIGQAMIAKLLLDWGFDGYIRWLRGIKATYAMRRDWMCDLLESTFDLEFDQKLPISKDITWVNAYEKQSLIPRGEKQGFFGDEKKTRKPLLSFVPPSAGMFVWVAVHLDRHRDFKKIEDEGKGDPNKVLVGKLWTKLAEHKVLVIPGYFFDGQPGIPHQGAKQLGFIRLSFSSVTHDEMAKSFVIFKKVLTEFLS